MSLYCFDKVACLQTLKSTLISDVIKYTKIYKGKELTSFTVFNKKCQVTHYALYLASQICYKHERKLPPTRIVTVIQSPGTSKD